MSGFGSFSKERILGALQYLTEPEKRDLAVALEAQWHDELDARCGQVKVDEVGNCLVSDPSVGCLYWLQNLTLTEDDHWLAKGTAPKAPFPKKEYFRYVLGEMQRPVVYASERCQQLYIPKTREMMTSLLTCGYISWLCQWRPGIFFVIQTSKEDKAAELIRYCKIMFDNQPEWLKKRHPVVRDNALVREWASGSRILGIPAGENQIRVHHPFGVMFDEAAFLPEFRECVNAVSPVAKQIIAISTANPGPFGDECDGSTPPNVCAASASPMTRRPEPVPEPAPPEEKSLEQEMDEVRQRILMRDPEKEAWSQNRADRQMSGHTPGAFSSVPPPVRPWDEHAEIRQLEELAAKIHRRGGRE